MEERINCVWEGGLADNFFHCDYGDKKFYITEDGKTYTRDGCYRKLLKHMYKNKFCKPLLSFFAMIILFPSIIVMNIEALFERGENGRKNKIKD